jgi:tRNA-splicing ligase RtcB
MKQVISDTKRPIKIWTDEVEPEAEKQLRTLADLPFIYRHVAVMPDVHAGKGSTVGTVIATQGAIIPAAVGVDIGCGMCAVKLPFKIDVFKDLKTLRSAIEAVVPTGTSSNTEISQRTGQALMALGETNAQQVSMQRAASQLGSLGGGNHFIEICKDQEDGAWVMLHSGSRNIGKTLADIHINKAKDLMKRYFIDIPDPDLAYLVQDTPEFKAYIHDLLWAQEYAHENRKEMMLRVLSEISKAVYGEDVGPDKMIDLQVDCHHNYTNMENHFGKNVWVTRKGAVSARDGQLGIIPGSMGAKSFIVKGKGNADSFCSCSHGAGRRMSRTKAKQQFTVEDLIKQTEGIECRKDAAVIDEIPSSYKDIDVVMANQTDLVEPLYTLNQLMCIKGA